MRVNQWLYRGGRPNRFARMLNRAWAVVWGAGLWPRRMNALQVRGRRTGRRISLPVVVADYDGDRYLVAMLGADSDWVSNVRADHGHAVLRHGAREAVWLEEIEPDQSAPVIRRYLDVAPAARGHFEVQKHAPMTEFERIALEHPVFRIHPVRGQHAVSPSAAGARSSNETR
jgi:hypothetical protein